MIFTSNGPLRDAKSLRRGAKCTERPPTRQLPTVIVNKSCRASPRLRYDENAAFAAILCRFSRSMNLDPQTAFGLQC